MSDAENRRLISNFLKGGIVNVDIEDLLRIQQACDKEVKRRNAFSNPYRLPTAYAGMPQSYVIHGYAVVKAHEDDLIFGPGGASRRTLNVDHGGCVVLEATHGGWRVRSDSTGVL